MENCPHFYRTDDDTQTFTKCLLLRLFRPLSLPIKHEKYINSFSLCPF